MGYLAWLLLPLVISVFVKGGSTEETMVLSQFLIEIGFAAIVLTITATFILAIPYFDQQKQPPVNISKKAWDLMAPFILSSLLVGIITIIGIPLILPAIIFSVWFVFAPIIVLLEDQRIIESLKTSKRLVNGMFWSIFWRHIGGGFFFFLMYTFLLAAILSPQLTAIEQISQITEIKPSLLQEITMRLVDFMLLPISITYTTILYLRLKEVKAE